MEKEFIIYLPRVTPTFFEVEGYALALCSFARDAGGRVWAGWAKEGAGVVVRIQNLSRTMVRVGTSTLVDTTVAALGTLSLVEYTTKISPLPNLSESIPWGTLMPKPLRLTKRLVLILPLGSYVVSRRAVNGRAVFAERLGKTRERAWRRAVEVRAAGRSCYLAWSPPQFDEERLLWASHLT